MKRPVSVIIPVWNMARFLSDAIASIPEVNEIIIVAARDNDDDTLRVANDIAERRRGVRILSDPGQGPATARNVGLRAATGEVVAFIDADDIWPQRKLETQLERLDRSPRVDVVAGLVTYFHELDREKLAPAPCSRIRIAFIQHVAAMIFRRSVFDRIGLFDETLLYAEDSDLLLRILEAQIPFVILDTPTLYYRRHDDSMMARDHPRKNSDIARALAKSLVRRRERGLSLKPVSFDRYLESASEREPT